MNKIQKEISQKMSPVQKFRIASQLYWSERTLKTDAVKKQHSDWSDEQIEKFVREIFLYAKG